jgi:glycosyltransferase involved in cell wall biosynthesis
VTVETAVAEYRGGVDGLQRSALRILHVAPLPPPVSGIGVSFQHFVASAPLAQQRNWIISSSGTAATSARAKRPTPRRILRHARLTAQVVRVARQQRVDVVHLHGSSHDLSFLANGLSVAAAGLAGARTVWHLHEDLSVVQFPGRSALTRATFAGLMAAPDILALLTEKDTAIARQFVADRKLAAIPPTCSPEMLVLPVRRDHTPVRVLFVGWLSEAKGIYDLLRTAAMVRDAGSGPIPEFWLAGTARSEDQARSVRACIEELRLQSVVKLCGVVAGAEKRRVFSESHVLFMPTHLDAFPVTVLEAMAAGLPVVATNVGGLPLMLENGRGAYLSLVGDVASMAEHVQELAANPARRVAMGEANRQRFLERYHPDRVGQLAVDVYERLAGSGRPYGLTRGVV